MTLSFGTAYRSFGGEVEASSTPTICRLSDSHRHQLSAIARTSLPFGNLPPAFDDFTILHLSDLRADISEGAMRRLVSIVGALEYDICVLTGDYRGKTYGPFENALQSLSELRALLKGPLYGVLGNHDSLM